jgi:hypothetical protein
MTGLVKIVRADQTVTVDGEPIEIDFGVDPDIQAALAKEPHLRVLTVEGSEGYIERDAGLSGVFSDMDFVAPFVAAHRAARRRNTRAAKRRAESDLRERNKIIAEQEAAAAEEKRKKDERDRIAGEARAQQEAELKEAGEKRAREAANWQALSLLAKADEIAVRCLKCGVPYPPEWQAYDEALRAIARESPPNIDEVVWPAVPLKPEGMK